MKLTRRIKSRFTAKAPEVTTVPFIIYDEGHSVFAQTSEEQSAFAALVQSHRTQGTRSMIATQAVIKANSGKRTRFIGDTRWSDGAPLKAAPKKFQPAQIARQVIAF